MKLFVLTIVSCLFASLAQAGPDWVSVLIGSKHVNANRSFEEVNPGVFATWVNPRLHWTLGAYRNSYGRGSVSATVAAPVLRWDDGEASLFVGAALYPKDGRKFAAHIGDVVAIGGVQLRHKKVFMQALPLGGDWDKPVFSFGLTFPTNQNK